MSYNKTSVNVVVSACYCHFAGASTVGVHCHINLSWRGIAMNLGKGKDALNVLFFKTRVEIVFDHSVKLALGGGRVMHIQALEPSDSPFRQPKGPLLDVGALDLLAFLQFEALLANHMAIDDSEKELVRVFFLDCGQLGKVVVCCLGGGKRDQRRVFHRKDGHNGFVKEIFLNVGCLVDDDDIGTGSAGGLWGKGWLDEKRGSFVIGFLGKIDILFQSHQNTSYLILIMFQKILNRVNVIRVQPGKLMFYVVNEQQRV